MALAFTGFIAGALVSLATSWILVTRLERVGQRFGFSEALLGVVAALAADAPEITAAVSALSRHQRALGAGVVIGSNVFNLAALLGLGAVVSGFIMLHRRVVVLGGFVAMWTALCCVAVVTGLITALVGLVLSAVVLTCYLVVLGLDQKTLARLALPREVTTWISSAVSEEEMELESAIRPSRGTPLDAAVAFAALVVVVLASAAMEWGASKLGHHFHVAGAITGGLVLAAVTSLPNAVAAVHLASSGRGAAAFSTALTSNNLNVIAGLLIPGTVIGLASPSAAGNLSAAAYLVITALVLVLAYASSGLNRRSGWAIIAGYVIFVSWLVAVS